MLCFKHSLQISSIESSDFGQYQKDQLNLQKDWYRITRFWENLWQKKWKYQKYNTKLVKYDAEVMSSQLVRPPYYKNN